MKKERILSIALAVSLTAALVVPATADLVRRTATVDSGVTVYRDGDKVSPTDVTGKAVDVFAENGTTYLPARALTDELGGQISYDAGTVSVYIDTLEADPKAAEYLETYFGVTASTSFNDALVKVFGEGAVKADGSTVGAAVTAAAANCGLQELAAVYSDEKAAASTAGTKVDAANAKAVAAALDAGLASGTWDFTAALDADTAAQLLMNAANIAGKGRNYLGNASDPDIARKLMSAWATFGNFDDPTLSQLGADLVIAQASTGYNLKYDGYDANFLNKYTLQYGHSDITHAVQLIALLNSEGMDAKVALEPKTSIYEYMVEWGDPTKVAATPTYALKPIEGTDRWLCYATEYDMQLEFDTVAEKDAFDALIQKYAKKWLDKIDPETGKPTEALLYGAWFQPLYTSRVPMADTENFTLIQDNVIHNGAYSIHPFSTKGGGDAIAKVVSEKAPDLTVEAVDLYVNNAFFRYLTGTGED